MAFDSQSEMLSSKPFTIMFGVLEDVKALLVDMSYSPVSELRAGHRLHGRFHLTHNTIPKVHAVLLCLRACRASRTLFFFRSIFKEEKI